MRYSMVTVSGLHSSVRVSYREGKGHLPVKMREVREIIRDPVFFVQIYGRCWSAIFALTLCKRLIGELLELL